MKTERRNYLHYTIVNELFYYLKSFINESYECNDSRTKEQARAIFTTICFIGNLDADTSTCDNMLLELYNETNMKEFISYDDFESYMIELIV